MMIKSIKYFLLALVWQNAFSQSVTIDPSSSNSKILDVKSPNKGLMPPKMTAAQRNAIPNPEIGLLVFDISKGSLYMFDGQYWLPLLPANIDASPFLMREANDGAEGDEFGFSVDIEGDWAVIGAEYADINGNANQGAVYVFRKVNGNWSQSIKIVANDGKANDRFGGSVDLSGNDLLIGASHAGNMLFAGAAYIYKRTTISSLGNTAIIWFFQKKLEASDKSSYSYFGIRVAIDGDVAVISGYSSYKRYIFERVNNTWAETIIIQPGFSSSAAISGSYITFGSNDPSIRKVAIYVKGGGTWSLQTEINPNDGITDDDFGTFVSISGDYILISATGINSNTGRAYIYHRTANSWTKQATLELPSGENVASAYFGRGKIVGDYAIITANPNDNATIYLFKRDGSNWTQIKKIDSYRTNGKFSFSGVTALAFDGTNLIFSDTYYNTKGKVFFCNLE